MQWIYRKLIIFTGIYQKMFFFFNVTLNLIAELETFRKITEQFIDIAENFAKQVDKEKMRAIGAQNLLKTITKLREQEQLEIQVSNFQSFCLLKLLTIISDTFQALIMDKSLELERLKIENQYLQRIENDQNEIIDNFYHNQ